MKVRYISALIFFLSISCINVAQARALCIRHIDNDTNENIRFIQRYIPPVDVDSQEKWANPNTCLPWSGGLAFGQQEFRIDVYYKCDNANNSANYKCDDTKPFAYIFAVYPADKYGQLVALFDGNNNNRLSQMSTIYYTGGGGNFWLCKTSKGTVGTIAEFNLKMTQEENGTIKFNFECNPQE